MFEHDCVAGRMTQVLTSLHFVELLVHALIPRRCMCPTSSAGLHDQLHSQIVLSHYCACKSVDNFPASLDSMSLSIHLQAAFTHPTPRRGSVAD